MDGLLNNKFFMWKCLHQAYTFITIILSSAHFFTVYSKNYVIIANDAITYIMHVYKTWLKMLKVVNITWYWKTIMPIKSEIFANYFIKLTQNSLKCNYVKEEYFTVV